MKIQIASDLHLEHLARRHPGHMTVVNTDADVLVLAGDIHADTKVYEAFSAWPVPIIYVHGNHELYDNDLRQVQRGLRQLAAPYSHIHFLENNELILGGVRFLGACLWTDYALYGNVRAAMAVARRDLNDHHLIRHDAVGERFAPEDALAVHEASRAWLQTKLTEPFNGKTVVVTHHGSHPESVHPKYAGDPLNAAFASDLAPLVELADLWIHGHTHTSFDYRVGKCRVICNPCGYPLNRSVEDPARLEFENDEFNPALVVEV